jgi:Mg/Co/Ni transporter MgtE
MARATILEELVEKKTKKSLLIKARIPEDLAEKITFICETTSIKEEDYLGKLLESTEIAKVFNSMKKESQKKITENEEN